VPVNKNKKSTVVVVLQLVCVSTELASSSSNIYLNLITKEETQYTVELTSQGFRVSIFIQWVSKNLVSSMQCVVFTLYT
jgi:hypothetical protein